MLIGILKSTWPLFLGIAFLMLGNGLQGTLISWRATFEGFSPSTTGLIMMGYYAGFLAGSLLTPKLVVGVGYIRVFAALASLASTAVLIQIVYINPINWLLMRLITGFCFAGAYVITESWLNARSSNETRGQTLSFYMLVSYASMAGGQWLLNLTPPSGFQLFLLSSILLSIAIIPILIKRTEVPEIESEENLSVLALIKISPAGVYGVFVASIAHGAMFAMGAVFAVKIGLNVSDTALFMSAFIAFGALAQWPLGWLSDRIDRRLVILFASIAAVTLCVLLLELEPATPLFFISYSILGASSLPLYSLAVAHTNDRLKPEQMTAASSSIVLIVGVGSIVAPIIAGYLLTTFGPNGFLMHIGIAHIIIAAGMVYFIFRREAVSEGDQTAYQVVPPRTSGVALEAIALEADESSETEQTSKD